MAWSEFALIDAFTEVFRPAPAPAGPGDDCAVLPPGRGDLCVTTDALVEDVHFTRAGSSLEDVGHKALAVNLSDLAAMGARPRWFLCALGLPEGTSGRDVRRLARGMAALAAEHRVALAGGNVTSSRGLSVTITAAGEVARGRALLRSGGRPGDGLYVSGTLGEARLGLELLQAGRASSRSGGIRRQRRPRPQVRLGLLAARWASAAIDLSDGFAQDLGHLCRASGAGAEVELAALPVGAEVRRHLGERAPLFAAAGGEDYELLLAVPPARGRALERGCARIGERLTRVGVLTAGQAQVFRSPTGEPVRQPRGYDHFLCAFDASEAHS